MTNKVKMKVLFRENGKPFYAKKQRQKKIPIKDKIAFEQELSKLGQWESEHMFAKKLKRQFRFDYCFPDSMLAIEIEGGVWIGGGHTHPTGFVKDMEKYNLACQLGWRILRYEPKHILNRSTLLQIKKTLDNINES